MGVCATSCVGSVGKSGCDVPLFQECITPDEVVINTEDAVRRLRSRASGSSALPEEFQTESGQRCHLGLCSLGAVVKSLHVPSNSLCSLKRISKKMLAGTEWRRDVEAIQDFNHPRICKTLDAFEDSTSVYLVMELCRGGNLASLAHMGSGVFTEAHVAVLVLQMVEAVSYLHGLGYVHCDICPENWLFEQPLETSSSLAALSLKMIDFGFTQKHSRDPPRKPSRYSYHTVAVPERRISRLITDGSSPGRRRQSVTGLSLTVPREQKLAETPNARLFCQAPEQLKSTSPDASMDVWALGVIAYFLLLGRSPFEPSRGVTDPSNNTAFRNGRYVFMPTEVWRQISNEAKSFIALCLELTPAQRPSAKMLSAMPWMRMARSALGGERSVPKNLQTEVDKVNEEKEAIPALSNVESLPASAPRRSLSFTSTLPTAELQRSKLLRLAEYHAFERDMVLAVAHEVHATLLQQLGTSLQEQDLDRSGVLPWSTVLRVARQWADLSLKDLEVPDNFGIVNYNDFLTDVETFQRNMQESAMWFAFSTFDLRCRGEAEKRALLRELGDDLSYIYECVRASFPNADLDTMLQQLEQVPTSMVSFEELLGILRRAPEAA
eukprot:CAMPEP_0181529320 /NCGR_PEP_ID=MMETSP1110-20121109/70994_1 /TAXON_ID=174948 /ORGANISM="Symbiodinium sp., Strain CCMP421" /LENGTH=607 /DNA_ID=CAMNT_0023660295 /DNA_START=1 /DNA_END=1820 /DNA_ORIENTATION=+